MEVGPSHVIFLPQHWPVFLHFWPCGLHATAGFFVGGLVGRVGAFVGRFVGALVGGLVGALVGTRVGRFVGARVGVCGSTVQVKVRSEKAV